MGSRVLNGLVGVAVGIVAGYSLTVVLAWGLAMAAGRLTRQAAAAWPLRPVIVAQRDLPSGSIVTMDDVSQRSIPAAWSAPSLIGPEDFALVVGQPIQAPLAEGDPLDLAFFEPVHLAEDDRQLASACDRALRGEVRAHETVAQLRARLTRGQ